MRPGIWRRRPRARVRAVCLSFVICVCVVVYGCLGKQSTITTHESTSGGVAHRLPKEYVPPAKPRPLTELEQKLIRVGDGDRMGAVRHERKNFLLATLENPTRPHPIWCFHMENNTRKITEEEEKNCAQLERALQSAQQHTNHQQTYVRVSSDGGELLQMDVVVTYVNDSVPKWREQAARAAALYGSPLDGKRYTDWNELMHCLTSIYKGAFWCPPYELCAVSRSPYFRRIYLVVAEEDHVPFWLTKSEHPLVHIVTHSALVSGLTNVLPTFNSNTIETLLHRIPGLSRYFLYFNNDMLLGRRLSLLDLFRPVFGGPIHLDRSVSAAIQLLPILYVEDVDDACYVAAANESKKKERTSPLLLCEKTSRGSHLDFYNFNRGLVYDRLGLFPSHAFAHVPRLFDREILRDMLETSSLFSDVVLTTRAAVFRSSLDLWVPYVYTYFAKRSSSHPFYVLREDPSRYLFVMVSDIVHLVQAAEYLYNDNNNNNPALFVTFNDDVDFAIRHVTVELWKILVRVTNNTTGGITKYVFPPPKLDLLRPHTFSTEMFVGKLNDVMERVSVSGQTMIE